MCCPKELPVEIIVEDQPSAEWHCKDRRKLLAESGNGVDIALIQIRTQLEGLWVYGLTGGMGDFVIYRDEERENRFVLLGGSTSHPVWRFFGVSFH